MTAEAALRVSVVITAYNYERFVAAAIESALAQGPKVEIIVVDDGSTDRTADVLAGYADRVMIISQPNGGQAAAFNTGLGAATGELVALLDADDTLLDGAIERLRATAADHPEAVLFLHPMTVIDAEGRPTGDTLPETGRRLPDGDLRPRLLTGPDDIAWQPASGLAFRASVLADVLPIPADDFRICADVYLMNTVGLLGPVAAVEGPGAGYRDHGANAHLRHELDLDRLRATVARSDLTHAQIRDRGRRLGLVDDDTEIRFRSVTDHASRLLLARLAPGPERVWPQVRHGVEAAWRRPDIGPARKAVMTGWFAAAAVAPRALLPRLAGLALSR